MSDYCPRCQRDRDIDPQTGYADATEPCGYCEDEMADEVWLSGQDALEDRGGDWAFEDARAEGGR